MTRPYVSGWFLTPMLIESITCLALALYHEARGEPLEGQLLVARVVRHRTAHPDFPDTICEVVNQPGQFAWVRHNPEPTDLEALARSWNLAESLLLGEIPPSTSPALFFHSGDAPGWASSFTLVAEVGGHKFYRR